MIKIFNANDKDFSSNGNILIIPRKCKEIKKKSLNGWFLDVEVDIKYIDYIKKDKLCVIKSKSKINPQAFRICNIEKTTRIIKFKAEHVMFDSKNIHLFDVRPVKQDAINALIYINDRTEDKSPFNIYSNVKNINTAYFIRKNLLEAWEIIEKRWNGVFDADNWNISFLNKTGNDNGANISYGKNMENIKIYEDWSNVCTKICPVGFDGLLLPEKYITSDIQYDVPYTRKVDFSTNLQEEEKNNQNLIEELRKNATDYIEENKYPKVSYEVISNINQDMEIGDIISVNHPLCTISTEVLEYEHNVMTGKIERIVFGNYSRDVQTKFDTIKENINQVKDVISKQEHVINNQTNIINNLNKLGHVYIDDNEILILDSLPKEKAKNVWRFGLGGMGFSSNGYEGPFDTAITMNGQINANFITTGVMSVDRIEGLADQISIIVTNNLKDTNHTMEELRFQQNELKMQLDGLKNTVENTGGLNLLRNSVGFFDNEFWEGKMKTINTTEIKSNSISGNGILIQNGIIKQEVQVKNGTYNVSFIYKKLKELSTCKLRINGINYELNSLDMYEFEVSIETTNNSIVIEFESDTNDSFWITDLLLVLGNKKQTWTQNANETTSETVKIGKGIQIESSKTNTYHRIDSDGNRTFNRTTGEVVSEQTDKGAAVKELLVRESAQICGCLCTQVQEIDPVTQEIEIQTWLAGIGG